MTKGLLSLPDNKLKYNKRISIYINNVLDLFKIDFNDSLESNIFSLAELSSIFETFLGGDILLDDFEESIFFHSKNVFRNSLEHSNINKTKNDLEKFSNKLSDKIKFLLNLLTSDSKNNNFLQLIIEAREDLIFYGQKSSNHYLDIQKLEDEIKINLKGLEDFKKIVLKFYALLLDSDNKILTNRIENLLRNIELAIEGNNLNDFFLDIKESIGEDYSNQLFFLSYIIDSLKISIIEGNVADLNLGVYLLDSKIEELVKDLHQFHHFWTDKDRLSDDFNKNKSINNIDKACDDLVDTSKDISLIGVNDEFEDDLLLSKKIGMVIGRFADFFYTVPIIEGNIIKIEGLCKIQINFNDEKECDLDCNTLNINIQIFDNNFSSNELGSKQQIYYLINLLKDQLGVGISFVGIGMPKLFDVLDEVETVNNISRVKLNFIKPLSIFLDNLDLNTLNTIDLKQDYLLMVKSIFVIFDDNLRKYFGDNYVTDEKNLLEALLDEINIIKVFLLKDLDYIFNHDNYLLLLKEKINKILEKFSYEESGFNKIINGLYKPNIHIPNKEVVDEGIINDNGGYWYRKRVIEKYSLGDPIIFKGQESAEITKNGIDFIMIVKSKDLYYENNGIWIKFTGFNSLVKEAYGEEFIINSINYHRFNLNKVGDCYISDESGELLKVDGKLVISISILGGNYIQIVTKGLGMPFIRDKNNILEDIEFDGLKIVELISINEGIGLFMLENGKSIDLIL